MALFNKYSIHDDIFGIFKGGGASYSSGRWMLGIIQDTLSFITGHNQFSLPLVNGILSIVFIAISACLLVYLFDIKKQVSCIAISGIMVSIPVISSLFGYMFTAPYYMFALLLSVVGCTLICKIHRWYCFAAGIILIACAIGIYQAFLPFSLCILLLYFFVFTYNDEEFSIKGFLKSSIYLLVAAIASLFLYFATNRIFLRLKDVSLTDYQGINNMGKMSVDTFFRRISLTYRLFFFPSAGETANIYSTHNGLLYYLILLFLIILTVVMLVKAYRDSIIKGVFLSLLIILFPCAINSIYIMCDETLVHTLMIYSVVFVFIFLIWLIENININNIKMNKAVGIIGLALVFCISAAYTWYDNVVYFFVELKQQQAISYYTCMEAQIKATQGYNDQYPVVFINSNDNKDISNNNEYIDQGFSIVNTVPYESYEIDQFENLITDYNWIEFMRVWTGYNPTIISADGFVNLPEVEAMPLYPDDGSIKVINDTVVVKF